MNGLTVYNPSVCYSPHPFLHLVVFEGMVYTNIETFW